MPHIVVKLYPGKSEAQKRELSAAIVGDVMRILNFGEEAVSVGFVEVQPSDWSSLVYEPDIQGRWASLAKTPGYGPGPSVANKGEG